MSRRQPKEHDRADQRRGERHEYYELAIHRGRLSKHSARGKALRGKLPSAVPVAGQAVGRQPVDDVLGCVSG